MNVRPLGKKLLVKLDPMEHRSKSGLWLSEIDSITYCRACPTTDPKIPCKPDVEWGLDKLKDRYVITDIRRTHDLRTVKRATTMGDARIGTVLLVGPKVRSVKVGDRIMIGLIAGGTNSDARMISEDAVLGLVEDEDVAG